MRTFLGAVALAFTVAACATPGGSLPGVSSVDESEAAEEQRRFVLTTQLEAETRVRNVSYRILSANADLCDRDVQSHLGIFIMQDQSVTKEYRRAAANLWGLDGRPRIMHVVPGSGAARAQLKRGDIIVSVNGVALGRDEKAGEQYAKAFENAKPGAPVAMTIERAGQRRKVSLRPAVGCSFPVFVNHDASPNAVTDGTNILVNSGLLKVARTDDELALVIGHELAHITQGHIRKKTRNAVLAGAGGLLIDVAFAMIGVNTNGAFTEITANAGRNAYSQSFEKEADYVGSYLIARAGYDTRGVERFWRQMAAEDPTSVQFAGTHPTSAERYALIIRTHEEILAKRAAKQPLLPNGAEQYRSKQPKRARAETR